MRNLWFAPAIAAGMVSLTGCYEMMDWGESDRYKQDFHYSYALNPGGTVSVDNYNGSVDIASWDQNTVEVDGTKYASRQSVLDDTKVDVSASPGSVRIRTIRPSDGHWNNGVRYSIHVPRRAQLDEIATTNGAIRIDGVDGNARLHTTNGSLRIDRIKGDVTARTTNGRIEAREIDGNTSLRTTNGSIDAEVEHGSFEADTTNGKIEATLTDPAPNWPVKLHSTNGHIEVYVRGTKVPDLRADTSNSAITVHLPASASFRVHANTSHSSVSSDFDGLSASSDEDDRGKHRRNQMDGSVGSGGALIELSSTNGSIKILKL